MCAAVEAGSSAAPQQPEASLAPQPGICFDQAHEAPGLAHSTVSNTAALPVLTPHVNREAVKGFDQAETGSPHNAAVNI